MWTYQLTNKYFENGQLCVVVEFSNSKDVFEKTFKLDAYQDDDWFTNAVNSEVDRLNNLTAYSELLDTKIDDAELVVDVEKFPTKTIEK